MEDRLKQIDHGAVIAFIIVKHILSTHKSIISVI